MYLSVLIETELVLCAFYRWLIRDKIVQVNPMERLDPIEQVEREPCPLPSETVTKFLHAIPNSNLRDRMLFTLLYEKGMQVGEALGLLATDVDLSTDDEKIRVFAECCSRVFGTQLDIDTTSC